MSNKSGGIIATSYQQTINFINQLQSLTNTSAGRDKCTKILQYGCKIIEEIIERTTAPTTENKEVLVRVQRVGAGLATARRVMRFWKPFQGYIALLQFIESLLTGKRQTVVNLFDLLSKLCMAHYFLVDHLTWASREKVLSDMSLEQAQKNEFFFATLFNNNRNADYSRISVNFWFYGVIFSLIAQGLKHAEFLRNNDKSFDFKDPQQKKMIRTFIALLCDLGTAAILAKKVGIQNKAVLGLLGVVSSLITIYDTWPSQ
ncbi:hypothetical protein ABK040_002299 [Willaertia magna]